MIQHFLSVGAGLFFALWATILTQYHHFQGPPTVPQPTPETKSIVIESPGIGSNESSPLTTLIEDIAKRVASSSISIPRTGTTTTVVRPSVPSLPQRPTAPALPSTPTIPSTPPTRPTTPAPTTPSTTPQPTPELPPTVDTKAQDEVLLRGAIVNIICLPGGGIRGSSGSGIVVDPRGIILTVAHVGQGLLLRDYPTKGAGSCYIRTGSPAKNAYAAELIYISPKWLKENKATFLQSNPSGTGENDFAFLAITESITKTPLPARFTAIPLAPPRTSIRVGEYVGTGSYAAEFLTSSEIRSSLYPTIKFAPVDDIYTFGTNTGDIFSVAAGSAAQEGSSGGAVMNSDDRLIGLISTRSIKPDLSQRALQALTMDHIRESFRSDTGMDLDAYLKNDLPTLIAAFKPTAETLLDELIRTITNAR